MPSIVASLGSLWSSWARRGPADTVESDETIRRQVEKVRNFIDDNRDNPLKYLVTVVASTGFFTDSYNLFATNVILPAIAFLYWPDARDHSRETTVNCLTLAGSLIGMLLFGWLADKYGRTNLYGIELVIVIASTVTVALAGEAKGGAVSLFSTLCWFRFIMGIGIGAEYPLSATITAEWAPTQSRGRMMAAVFFMQPLGQLTAQLVGLAVVSGQRPMCTYPYPGGYPTSQEDTDICLGAVERTWRIVAGVGAIPSLIALLFRFTIKDPGRWTVEVERNPDRGMRDTVESHNQQYQPTEELHNMNEHAPETAADAQEHASDGRTDQEFKPAPLRHLYKYVVTDGNWHYFAGVCLCWLLLDVAYYGLGINNPRTIARIWSYRPAPDGYITNLYGWVSDATEFTSLDADAPTIFHVMFDNTWHYICTISIGSLVGSISMIYLINFWSRKALLWMSFIILALLLFLTGGVFFACYHTASHGVLITLFALIHFMFNLGPNLLTFIIPAEIAPTPCRATFHGIAAASGKLGSIIVQAILPQVAALQGPNSRGLGVVLLIFGVVMLFGWPFAWAWLPEVQRPRGAAHTGRRRYEIENETLEELAKGEEAAEKKGERFGFRANFRHRMARMNT